MRKQIKQDLLQIISQSPIPEDYEHALNVLDWVMHFDPKADMALQLASILHDIERALPDRKVKQSDFPSFDEFKKAHAINSAKIARELLSQYPLTKETIDKICYLISYHEFGRDGDPKLGVLKDADSLSFFAINLPHFFKREGNKKTLFRMQWGYQRLSERARPYLKRIRYHEKVLNQYLRTLFEADANSIEYSNFCVFNVKNMS